MAAERTDTPADDLVARLEARRTQKRWVLAGKGYVQRDNPDPLCSEAAARIRSLEAQRDEAVGLLEPLAMMAGGANMNDPISKWLRIAHLKNAEAFLDSLKEER